MKIMPVFFVRILIISCCVFSFSAVSAFAQKGKPTLKKRIKVKIAAKAVKKRVVFSLADRWPKSRSGVVKIPVCWENPVRFPTETEWVKNQIEKTWEYYANIDFQGWNKCAPRSRGLHILIKDSRSFTHALGKKLNGMRNGMELNFMFKTTANFFPTCMERKEFCIRAIAAHEFGHALGLAHEQDRYDSECLESKYMKKGLSPLTGYDVRSVMNYCNRYWNNNGELSILDIAGIVEVYGRKN